MNTEPITGKIFTWDIHYACNYHCAYCYFNGRWDELAKSNVYPGVEKWVRVWNDIYDKHGACYLHISGGEPFCYPGINELVAALARRHRIGFDTNLFFDVPAFVKAVKDPENVGFSATFHPGGVPADEFIRNAVLLRSSGFRIKSVNFVAYPPHLPRLAEYRSKIEQAGLELTILPYRGTFEGREYPQSYRDDEREKVWGVRPPEKPAPQATPASNDIAPASASVSMLNWYGGDKDGREGRMCRMGEVYAKVHPDGTAHRCCMTWENWGRLGNMLDGSFAFYEGPRPCPYAKCSCSSAMIVGEETRWQDHWRNRAR